MNKDILEVCATGETPEKVVMALEEIVGARFATLFIEHGVLDFNAGLGPLASRYEDGSVLATFYPAPRGIALHGLAPAKDEGSAVYHVAIGSDGKFLKAQGEIRVNTRGVYTQRLESALFRLATELKAGFQMNTAIGGSGTEIFFDLQTGYNRSEPPEAVAVLNRTPVEGQIFERILVCGPPPLSASYTG